MACFLFLHFLLLGDICFPIKKQQGFHMEEKPTSSTPPPKKKKRFKVFLQQRDLGCGMRGVMAGANGCLITTLSLLLLQLHKEVPGALHNWSGLQPQPPTVVGKMEAQSEYVRVACTFSHVWHRFACSVGAYQQNFCIGAQSKLY